MEKIEQKHFFVTGEKGVGKSTLLREVIQELGLDVGLRGFVTLPYYEGDRRKGFYLHSIGEIEDNDQPISSQPTETTCVPVLETFESLGVATLQQARSADNEWILMDELGVLESGAKCFRAEVIRCLESSKHVLGVLKAKPHPFLESIKEREDTKVYEMTSHNRSEVKEAMKKRIGILLVGILLVGSLGGCTPKVEKEVVEVQEAAAYPRTVTDQMGREVTIEKAPERIVSSYYIASSLLIALGAEERVVGIEMKADTREIYKLAAPQFLELPAVGNSKTINVEECLALDADLVIIPTRLKEFIPQLEALNIPVMVVEPESIEAFLACVELVGIAINEEDKAAELIDYHHEVMAEAKALTEQVEKRPRVYLAGSGELLRTCTARMYQHSLIEMAGGENVSATLEEDYWVNISPEQLLAWNPEVIYAVSYADYGLDAITEDGKYGTLEAVKNGDVYTFPSSIEPWDYPTPSSALGIFWTIHNLHPALFSRESYVEEAQRFYEDFYDVQVSEEALGL